MSDVCQNLSDICELIVDCEHKTAPTQEIGYPSIRTPNIGRGRLILDGANRVSEETYRKWSRRAVPQAQDLILAREAPIGNVAIIPKNLRVCLGQRTVLIRPDKNKVVPMFLLYLMLGDEIQDNLLAHSIGATVAHLNMRDIRNLKLPRLPPLPTQRKIAAILGAYDDLIENNTRRIKILEEMAGTIYREWFVEFRFPGHEKVRMVESELGLIPEEWEVKQLGEMCNVVMGQSPKSESYNELGEGLPFHQGVTDFGNRFPTDRIYCTIQKRTANPNDILFSVRAPVGRINVANKKIVIGRGLSAIRSKSGDQAFLLQQLKDRFQEEDTIGVGTIFNAIRKSGLMEINLLVPPDPLIAKFEEIVVPIASLLGILSKQNESLRETRDLLLPRLISGEFDVSDLDINTDGIQPRKGGTHIPHPLTEWLHSDEKILAGKPVIKGTRLSVEFIVDLLDHDWNEGKILENYPGITREEINACRAYQKKVTNASASG